MHRPQPATTMTQKTRAPYRGATGAVLALLAAGGCAAAETPTAEVQLQEVTVSAYGGADVPYDRSGVSVQLLDPAELRERGLTTLTEALTTVPGAYVQSGGDNQRGNVSSLTLRGFNGVGSILTMVDGMRTSGLSGGADITANTLARAHCHDLGNIEVLRGSQGAVYGNGAEGGVVYMETPEGSADKPHFRIFNEAGTHDSYTGHLSAQGRQGKLAYFLSETYERTNNSIHFLNGAKPPYKHSGRFTNASEALRLDYHASDAHTLTATFRREDADYNYAGPYGLTPYEFRSNLATLKWHGQVAEKYTASLMAGYFGTDYMFGHGYNYNLRNVQAEWRNALRWSDRHTTTASLTWVRSAFAAIYGGVRQPNTRNLDSTIGLCAAHSYTPTERICANLTARLDHSSTYQSLFTLRADASARFNNGRTRALVSIGRGYRAPDSFARSSSVYVDPLWGTTYRGNPNLDCETSWSADAGLEHELAEGHTAAATIFWQRREKALSTAYLEDGSSMSVNAPGHWLAQGVELTLRGCWEPHWNTGYSLGWTYTRPLQADRKQAPCTARQVWSADIHTTPAEGFTTGLGLSAAVGRTGFASNYQPYRNDNYCTLRWYARYKVSDHLTLHLRVENLTNQKYVTESAYTVGNPDAYAQSIICAGTAAHFACELSF